jgi:UDP-glucose 4-epimerase
LNVLVTGAAGFIGSHLCEHLADTGHAVMGVDNFLTGQNNRQDVNELDIRDRHALYDAANTVEPDLVIHCAASYSDPSLWHRDAETNVVGTINATLAAKHHGARLFYFNTALPPISSYAISKIAGGQYLEQSGVPYVTFRLSNIYGPRNLSGPIPTFYKRLTAGDRCTVTNTRRDMVYIDDLVNAVFKAVETPDFAGTVDICSGQHLPIIDLFTAVAEILDSGAAADQIPAPADDVPQMQLDRKRSQQELGWVPVTGLYRGVAAAVDWYRANGVAETFTHLKLKG